MHRQDDRTIANRPEPLNQFTKKLSLTWQERDGSSFCHAVEVPQTADVQKFIEIWHTLSLLLAISAVPISKSRSTG
jgi:hypothetical protein